MQFFLPMKSKNYSVIAAMAIQGIEAFMISKEAKDYDHSKNLMCNKFCKFINK